MYRTIAAPGVILLVLGFAAGGFFTRHRWLPAPAGPAEPTMPTTAAGAEVPNEQVKLSPQAQRNLDLTSKPLRLTSYRRTIQIPGAVVDRPGLSARGVSAPTAGVVAAIHRQPGDVVRPGEPLFTVRLVGESLHASQTELFKAVKDQEIQQSEIDRLESLVSTGGIPRARIIDLQNELRRSAVAVHARRQDLQLRGLTFAQIDDVAQGTFLSEVVVSAPPETSDSLGATAGSSFATAPEVPADSSSAGSSAQSPAVFEVQSLSVQLGQQVETGQSLCTLSDHRWLLVEGRAFQPEVPLLQRVAEHASPITLELLEEVDHGWASPVPPAAIHHLSNTLNEDGRTVSFFLPLANQYRTYRRGDDTLLLWRFRPGQRVRLHVEVETIEDVFVLPADAVVKEGPESYVFRRNGDLFDRRPVHVLHRTEDEVVIANDGGLPPGIYVAQTGAVQLNRVLKSQGGSAPAGVHVHADGSVHANH